MVTAVSAIANGGTHIKPRIVKKIINSKTGEEKFVLRAGTNQLKMALDKKINPKADVESELKDVFDVVELNNTNLYYSA